MSSRKLSRLLEEEKRWQSVKDFKLSAVGRAEEEFQEADARLLAAQQNLIRYYQDYGLWQSRDGQAVALDCGSYQEAIDASQATLRFYDKGYGWKIWENIGTTYFVVVNQYDRNTDTEYTGAIITTLICLNREELNGAADKF